MLGACKKQSQPEAATIKRDRTAFSSDNFSESASIVSAARKAFPESEQISLMDYWPSSDDTHDFVVFYTSREIKGGFESMYWRYVVFVKKKSEREWLNARVFDLPDNHPGPFSRSLGWLEQNAKEAKPSNQGPKADR